MAINYTVRSNGLLGDKERHAAMVRPIGTLELQQVVEYMARTGAKVPDTLAALEHFYAAVESLLRLGYNVNTPLANFHLSVTGTFRDESDRFDRRRHKLVARVTVGKRLRRALRHGLSMHREMPGVPRPEPRTYSDTASGERNRTITPGGLGRLCGYSLRLDQGDPRQGVFFIAADRRVTPVSSIAMNRGRQLIFLVPDLPPGSYALEVRATADDSDDVRAGRLEGLVVPDPEPEGVPAAARAAQDGRLP